MKKIAFSLFLVLVFAAATFGQQAPRGVCGTTIEDQKTMLEGRENAGPVSAERGAVQYVPIHFHLTSNSAGTGKLRPAKVLDLMCQLNEDYSKFDLRFYLSPHPTQGLFDESIKHDMVFDDQSNTFLMKNRKHAKALNVYVVGTAASGNMQPGTTLAYYTPANDWIVSKRDQINGSANNGTLQHEIGHFFSLAHTFYGWEEESFTPAYPGWPIAPLISPGGSPTEKVDGTNCTTAADKICDTPPDYNFGFVQSGCGVYSGGAKDPLGVLVDPMENNFMSYFSNCSNYEFTDGQITEIKENLNLASRNYLDNTFVPVAETLTSPADLLISPIAGAITPFYDLVDFSWKPVAGATYYIFEIDRLSSFSSAEYQTILSTGTLAQLLNLKKNISYYWRVRPFNEYATCDIGKTNSFKAGQLSSGVKDIDAVNTWSLVPNPVSGESNLQIQVEATQSFEATIQVFNAIGQVVFSKSGQNFSEGENLFPVENTKLAPGIYHVSLLSGDAVMSKKLVVTN